MTVSSLTLRAVVAALVAIAALALTSGASAQYPLESGRLSTPGTAPSEPLAPGARVSVAGGGFQPGTTVQIFLFSTPTLLATVNAGGAGAIDAQVTIPPGTPSGDHRLEARGAASGGGTLVLSLPVVVAASTGDGTSDDDTTAGAPATTADDTGTGTADARPIAGAEAARRTEGGPAPTAAPAATGTRDGGTLPLTGMSVWLVALIGAAALSAGVALRFLSKIRRTG